MMNVRKDLIKVRIRFSDLQVGERCETRRFLHHENKMRAQKVDILVVRVCVTHCVMKPL